MRLGDDSPSWGERHGSGFVKELTQSHLLTQSWTTASMARIPDPRSLPPSSRKVFLLKVHQLSKSHHQLPTKCSNTRPQTIHIQSTRVLRDAPQYTDANRGSLWETESGHCLIIHRTYHFKYKLLTLSGTPYNSQEILSLRNTTRVPLLSLMFQGDFSPPEFHIWMNKIVVSRYSREFTQKFI